MTKTIAIIGAGPYGLSLAAHLGGIPGVHVRIFGEPMSFWQDFMPKGMFLRSGWRASHFSDPRAVATLDAYRSSTREQFSTPIPIENFVSYGKWFQKQLVRGLEPHKVIGLSASNSVFQLTLSNGDRASADAVIVATGIAPFAWRPPAFAALSKDLASHSSDHVDFANFRGKSVAVLGGGQSALESAALLQETGASVEVFVRSPQLYWIGWKERVNLLGPLARLLYSWTDVGPAGISQLVARPHYFRTLPRTVQTPLARRSIRPAGAAWLRPRLANTPVHLSRTISQAAANGHGLQLCLSDGSNRHFDHLLLATGYRVDCSRYNFLAPQLKTQLRCVDGYPVLDRAFESSKPGLHFVGAPAAWSYGPLMRFVAGTHFTCRVLSHHFRNHF